jgi:transposase
LREKLIVSPAQRIEIIALLYTGFSKNAISTRLGIHHSSVERWIRRYEETGALEETILPGQRRLTTKEEDFNLACCGILLIYF